MIDDPKMVGSLLANLANLGGVGVLAVCLFYLHRDAIKAFREELGKERSIYREEMAIERSERHVSLADWKREKAGYHTEVISRLDRIEDEVKTIRSLCGG